MAASRQSSRSSSDRASDRASTDGRAWRIRRARPRRDGRVRRRHRRHGSSLKSAARPTDIHGRPSSRMRRSTERAKESGRCLFLAIPAHFSCHPAQAGIHARAEFKGDRCRTARRRVVSRLELRLWVRKHPSVTSAEMAASSQIRKQCENSKFDAHRVTAMSGATQIQCRC